MDFGVLWLVLYLISKWNPVVTCLLDLEFVCQGNFNDLCNPMARDYCSFVLDFELSIEPLNADISENI